MDFIDIHMSKELREMKNQMEQMMDEMFQIGRTYFPRARTCWAPPSDIYETRDQIIVVFEMAGVQKEDIQVVLDQGVLKVSGRRANPVQDRERRVHQMEIDFGPFERLVFIEVPIDLEGVEALYREGFLVVRIPKAPRVKREIQINKPSE